MAGHIIAQACTTGYGIGGCDMPAGRNLQFHHAFVFAAYLQPGPGLAAADTTTTAGTALLNNR